MIKFKTTARKNGKCLLGFGLSFENLRRLKEGDPILVDAEQVQATDFADVDRIIIFAGEDEDSMMKSRMIAELGGLNGCDMRRNPPEDGI